MTLTVRVTGRADAAVLSPSVGPSGRSGGGRRAGAMLCPSQPWEQDDGRDGRDDRHQDHRRWQLGRVAVEPGEHDAVLSGAEPVTSSHTDSGTCTPAWWDANGREAATRPAQALRRGTGLRSSPCLPVAPGPAARTCIRRMPGPTRGAVDESYSVISAMPTSPTEARPREVPADGEPWKTQTARTGRRSCFTKPHAMGPRDRLQACPRGWEAPSKMCNR